MLKALRYAAIVILTGVTVAYASVTVNVNGSSYTIPQSGEKGWGTNVTSWIQAISAAALYPNSASFTLGAELDFGASYGLKSLYYKSRTSNPATTGQIRLANTDGIYWRNSGNSANLSLVPATDGILSYNSVNLANISTAQTLTNKTIDAASNTISNIVNANVSGSAAIAYSKLNLSSSIVNADVSGSAAIDRTKLASGTASHVLVNDGSGVMSSAAQLPTSAGGTGQNLSASTGALSVAAGTVSAGTLSVANGGTGSTTLTANNVLLGNGTSALQVVAPGSSGNVLSSNGTTWVSSAPASAPTASYELSNVGLAASVAGNALTIALKQSDGSTDCSTGTAQCKIGMRSSTLTSGSYNQRSVTSSLSVVVSSGSTLGTTSGVASDVYVYAIDQAGTIELAVSLGKFIDEGVLVTTTAEGGAGAADSGSVIYSTTARTNVPARLIGKVTSTQGTAGTWATSPSAVAVVPFKNLILPRYCVRVANGGSASVGAQSGGHWISSVNRSSAGIVEVNFVSGVFSKEPICNANVIAASTPNRTTVIDAAASTSQIVVQTGIATTGGYNDHGFSLCCQESM